MIYLATPYSHPSPEVMEQRFREAARIAGRLMATGEIVFCPITHTHPIAVECELPRGWEFWHKFDHFFISASDKLVVAKMEGWEQSRGVTAEIEIAKELGKPIEYIDVEVTA